MEINTSVNLDQVGNVGVIHDDSVDIVYHCVMDKYIIKEQIGKGGFSVVYLAMDKSDPSKVYAIKAIQAPSRSRLEMAKEEIIIHKNLAVNFPKFVVRIFDTFVSANNAYIVMEHCEGGSLSDFMKGSTEPLDVNIAIDVMLQIIHALQLMHANKIMHRDLTMGNVLIKQIIRDNNGHVKKLHVKIADFGASKRNVVEEDRLSTIIGTPAFMAP